MAEKQSNSKQSKYTARKEELKSKNLDIQSKIKEIPKRKLSTNKSKPMVVPQNIVDAVNILGNVIDADDFLNSLNNDLNTIADTQGDCSNGEAVLAEANKKGITSNIASKIQPVRLKKVLEKQEIRKAVVSLKAEESLKMTDIEKVVRADISGRNFLKQTKVADDLKQQSQKTYRSSQVKVSQNKKTKPSRFTIDFKKTLQKARDTKQFNVPAKVDVPIEDLKCVPTVVTDAEKEAGKQEGDKLMNSVVADAVENEALLNKLAVESQIPIDQLEEYTPPETDDERELAKREGEKSANNTIAAILGGVLVAGALASAIVIALKFKSKHVRQQNELDEILKKIQEIAANNKSFMDDVQAELERIPGYIDDYFHSWFLFDYFFYTLLLRYIETNQQNNLDILMQQIDTMIAAIDDGEERKSPMANSIVSKTKDKLFNLKQGVWSGATVPNGPSIDSLNVGAKKNAVKNIVEGQLEGLSNRSNAVRSSDIVFDYSVSQGEKTSGSLYNFLVISSREPTQQEAETNKYVTNILAETDAYYNNTMMDSVLPANENQMKSAAQTAYKLVSYLGNLSAFLNGWESILAKALESTEKLRDAYEFTHPEFNEERVREQIAQAGMEVDALTGDTSGSGTSGGASLSKAASEGNSELTFPEPPAQTGMYTYGSDDTATLEQINYWNYWAGILNIVTLSPQYWATGLYVPGPNGVTKIPLPIFWFPLVVIPTPFAVMVIFLTVNGIVISPTVWMITFKPLPDSKSRHIVLFRGANVDITGKKVETKSLGNTLVGGIDMFPQQHMNSVLIKDDIPVPERMTLGNFLWIKYLNSWCSKAKPKMGLP